MGPLEVLGDGCQVVWGTGAVFGALVYLLKVSGDFLYVSCLY